MEEKKKPRIGFSLFITNLAESFSKNPPLRTFGDTGGGGGRGGFVEGVGLGILLLPSSVPSSRKTRPLPIVSIQKDPPAILNKTNVGVGVGDGDGEEEDCACVMSRFERDFARKELWGKDFLSRCFLCRKLLHGLDIFMSRGEDAFCSVECREKQIVREDYRENCGSEARRTPEYSVSPRSSPRFLFSVVAAA